MCGIAGWYAPGSPIEHAAMPRMLARMVHRGPDDEGMHFDAHVALGMRRPWLPRKALSVQITRQGVHAFVQNSRGAARAIDALLKPRLTILSGPPFVNVIAVLCIGAALITFPLGLIPFAPLAPGLAVVFFGLGMTARDGLWLLLGTALAGGAFYLATKVIF